MKTKMRIRFVHRNWIFSRPSEILLATICLVSIFWIDLQQQQQPTSYNDNNFYMAVQGVPIVDDVETTLQPISDENNPHDESVLLQRNNASRQQQRKRQQQQRKLTLPIQFSGNTSSITNGVQWNNFSVPKGNPSRCRLNMTFEYVACWNGFGVVMRNGTKNDPSCYEKCVLVPWAQPTAFECGSCYPPTKKPIAPRSTRPTMAPIPTPTTGTPVTLPPGVTYQPITTKPIQPTTTSPITKLPTKRPIPNPTASSYQITLDLVGMPISDTTIFTTAAKRWSAIVRNDLPDVSSNQLQSAPFSGCQYPTVIDDLYICAKYESIDGPGQVLGSAGPTEIRTDGSKLTIAGRMRFDTADITGMRSSGILQAVIVHEMGHILGIGTLWRSKGVTATSISCPYQGFYASREYKALTGCKTVPIETDGGTGTRCVHFDDTCLQTELMTGYIGKGTSPLSRITIATLQDLGYTNVDYTQADTFQRADINPQCLCNRRLSSDAENAKKYSLANNVTTNNDNVFVLPFEYDDTSTTITTDVRTKSRRKHRKLSEQGQLIARSYGQALLRQARNDYDSAVATNDGNLRFDSSTIYVGADVISVLIKEGRTIYGVIVTSDAL